MIICHYLQSCCDDGFGDWKPHLAMILSNSGLKPEVEGKAIAILGDTLGIYFTLFQLSTSFYIILLLYV